MTNERETAPIHFGFSDTKIGTTLEWLRFYVPYAPADAENERARLAIQNPALATFMGEMTELRAAIHTQNHGAYAEAHQMGIYFGTELMRDQYGRESILSPQLVTAARTHFLSLLVDSHRTIESDPDFLELEKAIPEIEGSCLVPGILRRKYLTSSNDTLQRVMNRFNTNSRQKREEIFQNEQQLRKNSPTIQNIVGNGIYGFLDGLSDVYWPFQMTRVIEPFAQVVRDQHF